ncbi:MAG TPA: carotenoid oxygenase family protein [Ideonella sp.]|uniref:carotenoid oxygenase family protein n=1 Tax=Ideonella sp. TaxID=1929293 RepID=UPI002E377F46|nr:carotenoid oxygenase family protein [Ideonella sp.]HEX5686999.1 carotenoid oxygenase family protein [Ideonella sp.]
MQRRHFLSAGAAALVTPLALPAYAAGPAWQRPASFGDHAALQTMRGLQGQDLACDSASIEGQLPEGLRGTLYRNGPALFERAGQRYQHWFDGDGLVQAWRFDGTGSVSHRGRFVRTAKFQAEQAAGEFLLPAFGTAIRAKRPMRGPDDINVANTSVLPLPDRLLALWEGGSAYALDRDTLATRGPVRWSDELAGMPFSAHPKIEPDGTVWNFGTGMGKMVLYHLSATGELKRHAVFDMPPCAMVHDFVVTQRYLAFLLPPLTLDMDAVRAGGSFAGAMRWQAPGQARSTRVLVIDKADFERRRVFETPAEMVFHFANAWDDGDLLTLDYVRTPEAPVGEQRLRSIVHGDFRGSPSSQPALLRLNLRNGQHRSELGRDALEFPRVDPRVVGQRHRVVFYPAALGRDSAQRFGHDSVLRLDRDSGRRDAFTFGPDAVIEEHVFVPKPGGTREGEGWLVGAGHDLRWRASFASVFDAEHLSDGPLAVARLPYAVPHAFHGAFAAA